MSITIQCEHCDKKIEAPETAGGKWGKCPRCHNKVYVPKLESNEEEELRLAPIDEMEEQIFVEYDDSPSDIIVKANELLVKKGFELTWGASDEDGAQELILKEKAIK